MKKQVKKLVLAKETVRELTSADIHKAAGGDDSLPPVHCVPTQETDISCP